MQKAKGLLSSTLLARDYRAMKLFYIDRINDHVPGDFDSVERFLTAVTESLKKTTELDTGKHDIIRELLTCSLLQDTDCDVVVLRSENSLILTAYNHVIDYFQPTEVARKPVYDLEVRLIPDMEELNPQQHIPTRDVFECLQLTSIKTAAGKVRTILEGDDWNFTEKPYAEQEEPSHRRVQMFRKGDHYIFLSFACNERQLKHEGEDKAE